MFVGVARLVFQIPGARSLKDRRQVVKSFKDRVQARFPVSVAEVGELERYQVATLGLAVVSNDAAHCAEILSRVVSLARGTKNAVLADVATETLALGRGGSGITGGIEQALDAAPSGRVSASDPMTQKLAAWAADEGDSGEDP